MTAQEILDLVEKATGPDKIIDGEIAKLNRTMPKGAYFVVENMYGQECNQWTGGGYGAYKFYNPEPVTESIDAALALVSEMLPGHEWLVLKAALENGVYTEQLRDIAIGTALPLAILAALLKALIAKTAIVEKMTFGGTIDDSATTTDTTPWPGFSK